MENRHKHFKLTVEEEREIAERYKNGESIRAIEKTVSIGRTSIGRILKEYNVETKGMGNSYGTSNKKYSIDHKCFNQINTFEKAYWLGFFSADGHLHKKFDGITMVLKENDKDHLIKFLEFLKSDSELKYTKKTKSYRFSVYSKAMATDLKNMGYSNKKSYDAKFPKIEDYLFKYFIRGLFDGDGSLCYNIEKSTNHRNYAISFSGTESIITTLRDIISKVCEVSSSSIQKPLSKKGNEIFSTVCWGGNKNVLKILNWLYTDEPGISLNRKRENVFDFFKFYEAFQINPKKDYQ